LFQPQNMSPFILSIISPQIIDMFNSSYTDKIILLTNNLTNYISILFQIVVRLFSFNLFLAWLNFFYNCFTFLNFLNVALFGNLFVLHFFDHHLLLFTVCFCTIVTPGLEGSELLSMKHSLDEWMFNLGIVFFIFC